MLFLQTDRTRRSAATSCTRAEKQESPADRRPPVGSGFPASSQLVGLDRPPTYLGGLAGAIAPPLLADGAAIAPLLLSAGAIAGAAGAAAGAGGAALSEQAVSKSAAAARALRASFVFIDESPICMKNPNRSCEGKLVCGPCVPRISNSIVSLTYFKLPRYRRGPFRCRSCWRQWLRSKSLQRRRLRACAGLIVSAWRAGRGSR